MTPDTRITLYYEPVRPCDVRQSLWGVLLLPALLVLAAFGSALG